MLRAKVLRRLGSCSSSSGSCKSESPMRTIDWNSASELLYIPCLSCAMSSFHLDNQVPSKHVECKPRKSSSESADAKIFDIPAKYPTTENLLRWKKATLVLNAARRFRYTAELGEDKRLERIKKIRAISRAIIAANRFLQAGKITDVSFNELPKKLVKLMQDRTSDSVLELGGVGGVAHLLETNLEKGIYDDLMEVEKRKCAFGSNTYPRKPPKNYFSFLWDACKDLTLVILIICAMLSMGLGIKSDGIKEGWYDGVSIAVAVFLVILVTSISDYRQSLQFIALSEEKRNIKIQVIRGGRRQDVSIFDVVCGDIACLKIGDQVPADGLFVDGHALLLDESSMTGECEPVHVHNKMPFLLSGSKVSDGHGLMLVTGVGMLTEWGQLMAAIGEDNAEETPLQVRLNGVATLIGYVGTTVAVLVFVILLIFYFAGHTEGSNNSGKFKAGKTSASDAGNTVVGILIVAVTIVVVAVPEGLPLAVTLTLAYAMKKMIADKALVRRLSACETMGSATTICSDKTGTLTLNQMNVTKVWAGGEFRESVTELQKSQEFYNLLLEGIAQNSSGSVFFPKEGEEPEVMGSPTEKAVLLWGLQLGMDFEAIRRQSVILQVETFNSDKKRAGVAVQVLATRQINAHWKGAAEMIVDECDQILCLDGSTLPITMDEKSYLMHVVEGMAAESLRCVAFGFREVEVRDVPATKDDLESWKVPEGALTLLAIVGIKDPCRPEVCNAVQQCQAAGIKVRMITGDSILTAKAIATECGILQDEAGAIDGATFRNYTLEERRQEAPKIVVMARSSPSDKLLMVRTLQELGEVVAVTGDGTNDAPALREADIGLAMGIQGTEVAKESSDIIILDDNFASVVRVVRWGRSVYINIQKFIQFQLTVNIAALTVNFVAAMSSGDVPLTAVQLLWVNLIMDTLGALALATERPTDELLKRPPVGREEPMISPFMWRNILSQVVYQILVLLVLQFRGKSLLRLHGANADRINTTIIFNAFVFCQLFNEVNARKIEEQNIFRGLLTNWLFLGVLGFSVLFQVIIVEFLNDFASTVKLEWKYWVISIAIGFLSWPLSFLIKFIPVQKKPRVWPFRKSCRRRHEENQ